MGNEEDIDEYLDPELDEGVAGGAGDSEPIPGPLSMSQLVVGIHLLTAVAVLPFLFNAVRGGNAPQTATLSVLIVLLVIAGFYMRRVVRRRER